MCQLLGVSRSCYYHWLRTKKHDDTDVNKRIERVFIGSRQTYGTRRMKKQLERVDGLILSRRRIGKIMRHLELNTRNKRRFRVLTTNSNHNYAISPNRLQQDFYASQPDPSVHSVDRSCLLCEAHEEA